MCINVVPTQLQALDAYLALLERWNSVYNLTGIRDRKHMLVQHMADCLAVLPLMADVSGSVFDAGSGAGLPGVVISVMRPDLRVTCVDAVSKKTAFLQHVKGALRLTNMAALQARVEALSSHDQELVVSRAFASLGDFVRLTLGVIAPGGRWLAMKGRVPTNEFSDLQSVADVFHVEQLRVPGLDAARTLVWMRPVA